MGTGIRSQTTYHHLSGESVTLRQSGGEDVLDYFTKYGIAFIPYALLGANPLKHGAPAR